MFGILLLIFCPILAGVVTINRFGLFVWLCLNKNYDNGFEL